LAKTFFVNSSGASERESFKRLSGVDTLGIWSVVSLTSPAKLDPAAPKRSSETARHLAVQELNPGIEGGYDRWAFMSILHFSRSSGVSTALKPAIQEFAGYPEGLTSEWSGIREG
jgi:hypothetical protein